MTVRVQSHLPCNHVATDIRPGQRASRRQSQRNHVTSINNMGSPRSESVARRSLNVFQNTCCTIKGRKRSHTNLGSLHDGRMTTRRRSCMILVIGTLSSRKTGSAISHTTSRPIVRTDMSHYCCGTNPATLQLVVQLVVTFEDRSL